jgi:hypothetical protein
VPDAEIYQFRGKAAGRLANNILKLMVILKLADTAQLGYQSIQPRSKWVIKVEK